MIAWVCTVLFIRREDTSGRKKVLTAILVYILTVGLTYNLILRSLWKPEGLQLLADNLLHSIIPVLYLVFWLIFVKKHTLQWNNFLPWLIYPLLYLIYVMIRGAIFGVYPYPFIDVAQIGYPKALLNAVMVTGVIVIFSLLSVGYTKFFKK
jgi:apolipoprotein N-acyltransferase